MIEGEQNPYVIEQDRLSEEDDDRRINLKTAEVFAENLFEKYCTSIDQPISKEGLEDLLNHLNLSLGLEDINDPELVDDFIAANDFDGDGKFKLSDFKSLFINHLSTGTDKGYSVYN